MTKGSKVSGAAPEVVADGLGVSAGELEVVAAHPGGTTRRGRLAVLGERGMVSAEWAVGLIAAIAIAGVLVAIVTDGSVKSAILKFILMVIETMASHLGKA